MMSYKLLIAAILTTLSGTAFSATKEGTYMVLSKGNDSCGTFAAAVQQGNHQNNWAQWNSYKAYAMGYFTGVNIYEANTKDILGNTDDEGVMANLEKFCKENPLKSFIKALDATAEELYPNRVK